MSGSQQQPGMGNGQVTLIARRTRSGICYLATRNNLPALYPHSFIARHPRPSHCSQTRTFYPHPRLPGTRILPAPPMPVYPQFTSALGYFYPQYTHTLGVF